MQNKEQDHAGDSLSRFTNMSSRAERKAARKIPHSPMAGKGPVSSMWAVFAGGVPQWRKGSFVSY